MAQPLLMALALPSPVAFRLFFFSQCRAFVKTLPPSQYFSSLALHLKLLPVSQDLARIRSPSLMLISICSIFGSFAHQIFVVANSMPYPLCRC